MSRIPNQGFVNSLHGLDPLLSVYWGERIGQWVISRKAAITDTEVGLLKRREARLNRLMRTYDGHPEGLRKLATTLKTVSENIVAAEKGRRVILFSTELNAHLYDALVLADMHRYGGYAQFADKLEQEEAKREADLERAQQEQRIAFNKEVHGMLTHIWAKKESALLSGERDLRYLLHGQRSTPDSGPLIRITDF